MMSKKGKADSAPSALLTVLQKCRPKIDNFACLVKLKEQGKKVCKTYCAPMLSMHYLACDFLRSNSKLDWSAVKIPKSRNICTEPVKCCQSNLLSLEQVHNMYFTKGLSIYATGTLFPFFTHVR